MKTLKSFILVSLFLSVSGVSFACGPWYYSAADNRIYRFLPPDWQTSISFIEDLSDGRLAVRTYERGVEDETWACGTGVTACAIVSGNHSLVARGGDFRVDFDNDDTEYGNVYLIGPVSLNFEGTWTSSAQ